MVLKVKENKLPSRSLLSNIVLSAISLGLLTWSFRLLQARSTTVTGIDAVVNGAITDIQAPSKGTVTQMNVKTGDLILAEQSLLTIENSQVGKLKIQEITSQIDQYKAELLQAEAKLNQQLILIESLQADHQNQTRLEILEDEKSIEQVKSELEGARASYELAISNHRRISTLAAQGAVPRADLDAAQATKDQSVAQIKGLEAKKKMLQTDLEASKLGLSLSKTRSDSDPRIRLQEVQLESANQRQVVEMFKQKIKNSQAELLQAQVDIKKQEKTLVQAPQSGMIWRLSAQEGKFIQQGEPIGQILDCKQRWIDVFVDEKAVSSLEPGTPATIELYGTKSAVLHGEVHMMRSGLGRLNPGSDVAQPIAPNSPRNTQVRVGLNPDTEMGQPGVFCYVGYTGKVTFQVN